MRLDTKGQVMVEFVFVSLLVFLPLLFAVMDLGIMFCVNLTMQEAVRAGARYAVTGRLDKGTDRRSAITAVIREKSFGLYDKNRHNPKEPQISVIPPGKVTFDNFSGTPTTGKDPGNPNDLTVVSLTYTWRLLTPMLKPMFRGGEYTFTVKSTMQYEDFPSP